MTVSVTASGKYLYIIGGTRTHLALSIVLSFDTESRQWKRLPDLQMNVFCPSLVVANNSLIVAGIVSWERGYEDEERFEIVLKHQMKIFQKHQMKSLLLSSQQWIQVGSTIEWNPRLNVIHNLVVATGGLKSEFETLTVRRADAAPKHSPTEEPCMRLLDPYTKQWLPLPPPPVGCDSIAQHSTCVTEQQILMVLTQTHKDDRCLIYEMDIPCDMSSDPM